MTVIQVPFRLVSIPLVLALCACSSTVDIAFDDDVSFGDLQTSIPYSDDGRKRIRLSAMQTSGESKQSLAAFERIRLDDDEIVGPAEVGGEVDITRVTIAAGSDDYAFSASASDARTTWYWGLSYTEFDLALDHAGRRFRQSDNSLALYLQLGSVHPINESLRLGLSGALHIYDVILSLGSEFEVRLEYLLHEHARISGGLRLFFYEFDNDGTESDIEIDFTGPFIGLDIPF